MIPCPTLISHPYTIIFYRGWLFLKDFINGNNLAMRLLHLLQFPQKIPKLRLSTDFIGGPELHTVDLRLLISSSRQSSPNHLVLMKLCREKLKVKNKLKKRTPPESSASIHVFLHLSVSNSLLLITNHKLQTEGKTDHCQTVSRTAYDLPGKSP